MNRKFEKYIYYHKNNNSCFHQKVDFYRKCIFDVFDRLPPNFLQKLASILFPRWYPSTLPCHKITFKHFFLTQKQSSIPPSSSLRGLLQTLNPLSFSLSLSLSPFDVCGPRASAGRRERERRERERGWGSCVWGLPFHSPFHSIQRSWTLQRKTEQTLFLLGATLTRARATHARTHPRALTHKHLPNLLQTTMSILTGVCPCLSPPVFFAVFFLFAFLCFVQSCSLRCLAFLMLNLLQTSFFHPFYAVRLFRQKSKDFFQHFSDVLSPLSPLFRLAFVF